MTRALACLALFGALAAAPAFAQKRKAEAPEPQHTVIYSYEKWSRAEPARYVLEPQAAQIPPGDLADRTRALFKLLVGAKRGSYGDARLAFQDDYAKTGAVYVWLDEAKADYAPIVMAETVYTFTENGASKVIFPKKADGGWTRADVPFSAYVLVMPMWQVLPPAAMPGALAQLPDGTMMTAEAVNERLMKGDKALLDAMWGYVDQGGAAALAAVRAAPVVKMADRDDKLLPVLRLADTGLREAALAGLDGFDSKKVNTALRQVMDEDTEPRLRDTAALMLSKSKDTSFAAAAQYHALRSKDAKVVIAAAEALAQSKEKEATSHLLHALASEDAHIRAAVLTALSARNDTKAMIDALDDKSFEPPVKIEIARALTEVKDKKSVHAGLMHLATAAKGDLSAGAAAKLAEFDQKETYPVLGAALKHPEAPTRRAAASALSRLGDPAGLPLLAGADVADEETGESMRVAIRTIYAQQPLDAVLKATKEKNDILRREAVATLGTMVSQKGVAKSRKTIVETLRPLSEMSDPLIRAASARSFGSMPGDDVRPDIMRLGADQAIEVQRAVAHALRAFPGADSVKFLLGYMNGKDPVLLANAAESLGLLEEKEALNPVIARLNHDDVRVRRAATGALVRIGNTLDKRNPLLSFFSERLFDSDGEVRLKAVEGLRLVKDPRTVTAMAALVQDPVPEVRKATLLAMADTGHASAVEAIAGALEDDDAGIRKVAIDALARLKRKEAVKPLADYAEKEQDKALADEARRVVRTLKGG
ncbi:MAG: HEAT repeat domain-containing protein [Myxococcales bacterium]|nr:HEAT repeat domain-containing protein [Myxococcales bacterium]